MADTIDELLLAKPKKGFQFTKVYNNIDGDGSLYMKQVKLCATPWGCLWLHVFVNKDTGTLLHDHPMDFVSFILWGGYDETIAARCAYDEGDGIYHCGVWHRRVKWNPPFTIQRRTAECMHKVAIRGKLSITLVWKANTRREFCFLQEDILLHGPSFMKAWNDTKNFDAAIKAGAANAPNKTA